MFNLNNLQVKYSARLIAAAFIVLTSGVWILYATAIPTHLFLIMAAIGIMSTGHFILKYGFVALPNSIVRCDATSDTLYLTQRNGLKIKAIPMVSSYMSPHLLLLAWRPEQTILHKKYLFTPARLVILNSGNVSSLEDFRRLRVLLAFSKPKIATDPHL